MAAATATTAAIPIQRRRASARSLASASVNTCIEGRSLGSNASPRITRSCSHDGTLFDGGGAMRSSRTLSRSSSKVSAMKGWRPYSASKNVMHSENTSDAGVSF